MIKNHFIDMLNNQLSHRGLCSPLDCHSSIQLELPGMPAIIIELHSEKIVMSACIAEHHLTQLAVIITRFNEIMINHYQPAAEKLPPVIMVVDDNIIISTTMTEDDISHPDDYGDRLESFLYCCRALMYQTC